MEGTWLRVSQKLPCPICGPLHKRQSWCLVHVSREVCICPRVSEGAVKDLGEAGYLHRLVDRPVQRYALPHCNGHHHRRADSTLPSAPIDWNAMVAQCRRQARTSDVRWLSENLGVSVESLDRLGVGVRGELYAFPMADGVAVIGIRLRARDGRKWAVTGSRSGLFVPSGRSPGETLVICEGPTDTAAMLDLGYDAIGRPSCLGGASLVRPLCGGRRVVIMADADGPGQDGARKLSRELLNCAKSVRVVTPHAKDAREWVRAGATRRAVDAVIASSAIVGE